MESCIASRLHKRKHAIRIDDVVGFLQKKTLSGNILTGVFRPPVSLPSLLIFIATVEYLQSHCRSLEQLKWPGSSQLSTTFPYTL